jgi:hypothetical protein
MKKLLIIGSLLFATVAVKAQTTDAKIDTNSEKILFRNVNILQGYLHKVPIDAILRDKLDSVYTQTVNIINRDYNRAKMQVQKPEHKITKKP